MDGGKLLSKDHIVDVPVLPNAAPNAVGLTLDHRHAVHLLTRFGYKNTIAALCKRWNKVFPV